MHREVKFITAQELRTDLPKILRTRFPDNQQYSEITEELIEQYYMKLYTDSINASKDALNRRYSSQNLVVDNLLYRVFCDKKMSDGELKELGEFYKVDWEVAGILRERMLWFSRCARKGVNTTIYELKQQMKEEPIIKKCSRISILHL